MGGRAGEAGLVDVDGAFVQYFFGFFGLDHMDA
jgi:hypothetical protein